MKGVCIKNEKDFEGLSLQLVDHQKEVDNFIHKLKKTEYEKSSLISDNVKLLNQVETLKKELMNVTFRKESSNEYDTLNMYKEDLVAVRGQENVSQNLQFRSSEGRTNTASFKSMHEEFQSSHGQGDFTDEEQYHKKTYSYLTSHKEDLSQPDYSDRQTPIGDETEIDFGTSFKQSQSLKDSEFSQ